MSDTTVADRLSALLGGEWGALLTRYADALTEIRLRAGRPMQLVGAFGDVLSQEKMEADTLQNALSALMEHSVYARQAELDHGFFTLGDGSRVGVCGRMFTEGDRLRMGELGSACVRVARPVPGCADALNGIVAGEAVPRSTLLISPPGLGKTTQLRDLARQLSSRGLCVGVVDARHELAACHRGVPTLDVGPRSDVMDGCRVPEGITRLLRSMSPRVIVADEIGGAADARALAEAARCGVAVIASAHASSIDEALARTDLRHIMTNGGVARAVLLGPGLGMIREVWRYTGEEGRPWRPV